MNRMPYSAATSCPRGSAVTIVIRSAVDVDMAQQQRQDALPDAAEADDDETAGEGDVLLIEHGRRGVIGIAQPLGSTPRRRQGRCGFPGQRVPGRRDCNAGQLG